MEHRRVERLSLLGLCVLLTACPPSRDQSAKPQDAGSPKPVAPSAPPPATPPPPPPPPRAPEDAGAPAEEPAPTPSATPDSGVLREGSTTGQFQEFEQGDYFYVVIRTEQGQRESFRCRRGCEQFLTEPQRFAGKRIRVDWTAENVFIPEAGESQEVVFVKRVELLDGTQPTAHLCLDTERTVFACTVQGSQKLVSLCLDKANLERLTYRFGKPGKVELTYPAQGRPANEAFTYMRYTRSMMTLLKVEFTNGGYTYRVRQDDVDNESLAMVNLWPTQNPDKVTELGCQQPSGGEGLMKLEIDGVLEDQSTGGGW